MTPRLFEAETDLVALLEAVDEALSSEAGEVPPDLIAEAEAASLIAEEKRDRSAAFIRRCRAQEAHIEAELVRLSALLDRRVKARAWLEDQVALVMQAHGVKKLSGQDSTFTLVPNPPSVEVDEGAALPEGGYRTLAPVPARKVPDKRALGAMLKDGCVIEGVRMVEGGFRLKVS